jgi:hypothetical protein
MIRRSKAKIGSKTPSGISTQNPARQIPRNDCRLIEQRITRAETGTQIPNPSRKALQTGVYQWNDYEVEAKQKKPIH